MRIPGRARWIRVLTATLLGVSGSALEASGQDTTVVHLRALVQPRVSLAVSARSLTIPPSPPGETGPRTVGSITVRAAARTGTVGEVILTVEAQGDLDHLGGPSAGATALAFIGTGEGLLDGVLEERRPAVAGRWLSSGVREGHLTFAISGDVGPAGAIVPLRFVLSTP